MENHKKHENLFYFFTKTIAFSNSKNFNRIGKFKGKFLFIKSKWLRSFLDLIFNI